MVGQHHRSQRLSSLPRPSCPQAHSAYMFSPEEQATGPSLRPELEEAGTCIVLGLKFQGGAQDALLDGVQARENRCVPHREVRSAAVLRPVRVQLGEAGNVSGAKYGAGGDSDTSAEQADPGV